MKHDEFVKHVQAVAQLNSKEEAERAIQATLVTITDRIVGNEAKDLAAQLPAELARHLRGREGQNGQHFSLEEFYRLVADRSGVPPHYAAVHTRAKVNPARKHHGID